MGLKHQPHRQQAGEQPCNQADGCVAMQDAHGDIRVGMAEQTSQQVQRNQSPWIGPKKMP